MVKKIILVLLGLVSGVVIGFFILNNYKNPKFDTSQILSQIGLQKPEIIGFLPYWLIDQSNTDESYLNTISYFGLTIDEDGTILKMTKPTETEPGWLALQSGKINSTLDKAKQKNFKKSLVVFSANQENINRLMDDPVSHGKNLVNEVSPILNKSGFTDLNIDIENVSMASDSAREKFTLLTKTIHDQLQKINSSVTLSIDVSPIVLIKPYLIDVAAISPYVDKVILMTYDFHFQGSSVTGAVAPIGGGGISAEFDSEISIKEALKILSPEKIILGVPLYGYEWETLSDYPHAATIPGSGIVASNKRVEELLAKCASCSPQFDPVSQESYLIYKDDETNTFHQFFYPDEKAMQEKITLMKKYHLGGIALWALGYEGKTILEPIQNL